jgi:hypothetical protein
MKYLCVSALMGILMMENRYADVIFDKYIFVNRV